MINGSIITPTRTQPPNRYPRSFAVSVSSFYRCPKRFAGLVLMVCGRRHSADGRVVGSDPAPDETRKRGLQSPECRVSSTRQ